MLVVESAIRVYIQNRRHAHTVVPETFNSKYYSKFHGETDRSVGKFSVSHAGDSGSNPGGSLIRVTLCMNERGRDYQL